MAVLAIVTALGSGCATEDDPTSSTNQDDTPSVSWEEFRAGVYQEPWEGGAFIVDGDIPIYSEEGLRAFYDAWRRQESGSGALTVRNVGGVNKIWSSLIGHALTYCVSNDFGAQKAGVVSALAVATASWSNLASVLFRYRPDQDAACNASNGNVMFDVRPVSTTAYFARAFFPDDARSARELLIAPDAFTTSAGGRDLQGILRHELGHTLGFRHEHIHIDCTGESTSESRQITSYDVNSVMHYPQCRPSGGGGYRQTTRDYEGAIKLYGLAAPLIATVVE